MATIASNAWADFNCELACIDEEYLKRAFMIVWDARGKADAGLMPGVLKKLAADKGLDDPLKDMR